MYHFFAMHENIHETHIELTGSDVNHIKNVLRLKPGEEILVSSGDNIDYQCRILAISPDAVTAKIERQEECGRELGTKVFLFQGLPKGDKMEWIIQKMTELGVHKIYPVAMKRSVVKLDDKKAADKVKRWNAIAEVAAKQSKRSMIPEVAPVMTFPEAVREAASIDVKLLPYECAEGMERTKAIIQGLSAGNSVAVFIGPEGGFDREEIELALQSGWESITLGRRILRTETAGMMLMSVLMYHFEA